MNFCTSCGNQIPEGSTACPSCGAAITPAAPAAPATPVEATPVAPATPVEASPVAPVEAAPAAQPMGQPMAQPGMDPNMQGQAPMGQPMAQPGMNPNGGVDVNTEKGIAIIAYIIPIISYFMKPKTEFGKFHTNQGLNIWILNIVYNVIRSVAYNFLPSAINYVLYLGTGFFSIILLIGLIKAIQGKMDRLPVVSSIMIIKY